MNPEPIKIYLSTDKGTHAGLHEIYVKDHAPETVKEAISTFAGVARPLRISHCEFGGTRHTPGNGIKIDPQTGKTENHTQLVEGNIWMKINPQTEETQP